MIFTSSRSERKTLHLASPRLAPAVLRAVVLGKTAARHVPKKPAGRPPEAPPTCLDWSHTAERNNLPKLNPCCPVGYWTGYPSPPVSRILFTESNAPGATSMCDCSTGSFWDPSSEACTIPVQTPRCSPGLIFCPRLNSHVTEPVHKRTAYSPNRKLTNTMALSGGLVAP